MGNSNSSEETIDYGKLSPFGKLYPLSKDYSQQILANAIKNRKLQPFYQGLDSPEAFHLPTPINKKYSKKSNSNLFPKELLAIDPIECPICFLYYPKNINYSRCCDQPICTDCFLQIKRPESTFDPPTCPYCVQEHFGVVYHPVNSPGFDERYTDSAVPQRRKSISHLNPIVVTSDDLRPDWQARKEEKERQRVLEQQRAAMAQARRRQLEFLTENHLQMMLQNSQHSQGHVQGILLGTDVEELMMLEAIRRSMIEPTPQNDQTEEERQALAASLNDIQPQPATSTSTDNEESPPAQVDTVPDPIPSIPTSSTVDTTTAPRIPMAPENSLAFGDDDQQLTDLRDLESKLMAQQIIEEE
ncbi:hypothetical protein BC833DRAFT_624204 [Globomyces pollinis-pini]|nr:hypothetical protein BC833DRAFT_624204 [Globomyces pollinis-pini]